MIEELKQVRDALDAIFLTICPTTSWPSGQECQQGRITLDQYNLIRATLDRIIADHIPDASKMVVPDGYKLVPIEPTGPMIMSGIHAHERNDDLPNIGTGPKSVGIYKAMISAAPQPQPIDVEKLKREIADYNEPIEEMLKIEGWNEAIDHLAATGRLKGG